MPPSRTKILNRLEAGGLVAVIRADAADQVLPVCRALRDGGVTTWEITLTTPGALRAVEQVADELGDSGLVGVGTVLDAASATAAIHAGAMFVFSPITSPPILEATHRYDRVAVPGALTPTEIVTAWQAGADLVKLFPANRFGPGYLDDLRGPLPQVRITPTGGVTLETIPAWLKAGAVALGVGSSLVRRDLIRTADWPALTELARRYVTAVEQFRSDA